MTGRGAKALILCIVPLIIYVGLLPFMPLMEPDEGRYSAIPREMNQSGDYIVPRLKGAVYLEKPPLAYWATAFFFTLFGENEFSSRLFAALASWGCILLVYRMGRVLRDEKTGLYAAAVLATSLYHFAMGRINILDMPVTFFICLSTWSGYRYLQGGNKAGLYLFYLSSSLAFLTKGLIGLVFPWAIILLWLMTLKRGWEAARLVSLPGVLLLSAVTLPWLYLVQREHSDFLRFFFIQEHLQRYATAMHYRNEPFYFFIPVVLLGMLPWVAYLVQAVREQAPEWRRVSLFPQEEKRFLLVWAGFIFLFFSLSSSKLIPYIAAAFLPLALFQGELFSRYDGQRGEAGTTGRFRIPVLCQSVLFIVTLVVVPLAVRDRLPPFWWPLISLPIILQVLMVFLPEYVKAKRGGGWFVTVYLLSALFLGATIFPLSQFLAPYKSAYLLSREIQRYVPPGHDLYQFNMSLYGIDFYSRKRTPIVDDIGEVRYGSEFLPPGERSRYFLNSAEFFDLVKSGQQVYCATKGEANMSRLQKEVPPVTVLWDNDRYYLLRLGGEPEPGGRDRHLSVSGWNGQAEGSKSGG